MVKNNQLVCNTIHSCFLRLCKLNSYTLLNLNGLVLFPLLFDKPNARQCKSDMTDLYIIQHLCLKYTHTYIHTYIHTYLHTYVRTYPPTLLPAYIRTYVCTTTVPTLRKVGVPAKIRTDDLTNTSIECYT